MFYTIHGFYQKAAHELGLDNDDLLLLRWFVNFKDSGNMKSVNIDDEKYYWVNYQKLTEELPILGLKKDSIYRKLKKMSDVKVLKRKTIFDGGRYSYFTLDKNYITLINSKPVVPDCPDEDFNSKASNDSSIYSDENQPDLNPNYTDFTPNLMDFNPNLADSAPNLMDFNPNLTDSAPNLPDFNPNLTDSTPNLPDSSPNLMDFNPNLPDSSPNLTDFNPNPTILKFDQKIVKSNSNTILNKSNSNTKLERDIDITTNQYILSQLLLSLIQKNNPNFKRPDMALWSKEFDLILNVDKRDPSEVESVIKWVHLENPFWASQILCPHTLRKHYDKLIARKNYDENKSSSNIITGIFGTYDLSEFEEI